MTYGSLLPPYRIQSRSGPRVSNGFGPTKDFVVSLFLDTFRILDTFCIQNKTKQNKTKQNKTKQNKTKQNKTKQNKTKQENDQIPWKKNNFIQGILSFILFLNTFCIQKCLETEKRPNPLKKSLFSRELEHGTWNMELEHGTWEVYPWEVYPPDDPTIVENNCWCFHIHFHFSCNNVFLPLGNSNGGWKVLNLGGWKVLFGGMKRCNLGGWKDTNQGGWKVLGWNELWPILEPLLDFMYL